MTEPLDDEGQARDAAIAEAAALSPEDVKSAQIWHVLALAIGYNEVARLGKTLGEKAFARLARDKAAEEYAALTGITNLFAKEEAVLVIETPAPLPSMQFHEADVERMREVVAAHDAAKTSNVRELTIAQMIDALNARTCIYDILFRNAGVGIMYFEGPEGTAIERGDAWRQYLRVHRYYPTFEECIRGEYERTKGGEGR